MSGLSRTTRVQGPPANAPREAPTGAGTDPQALLGNQAVVEALASGRSDALGDLPPAGDLDRAGMAGLSDSVGTGSVMVASAAARSEQATSGTFTVVLTALLEDGWSLDGALRALDRASLPTSYARESDDPADAHRSRQPDQNADVAGYTATPSADYVYGGGAKRAVLVGNENYNGRGITDVADAGRETANLAGALAGSGYETIDVHINENATSMEKIYSDFLNTGDQGEELVVYYAGHGKTAGLLGVDSGGASGEDILPWSILNRLVDSAAKLGANVRLIVDACHSGAAVDQARDDREAFLAPEGTTDTELSYLDWVYDELGGYRGELLDFVRERKGRSNLIEQAGYDEVTVAPRWAEMLMELEMLLEGMDPGPQRQVGPGPREIPCYETLGAPLDYISRFQEAVLQALENRAAQV